jgi:hypothetical protein
MPFGQEPLIGLKKMLSPQYSRKSSPPGLDFCPSTRHGSSDFWVVLAIDATRARASHGAARARGRRLILRAITRKLADQGDVMAVLRATSYRHVERPGLGAPASQPLAKLGPSQRVQDVLLLEPAPPRLIDAVLHEA